MDQELAKRLLVEGAILVVLDVPFGTSFGMDMKSWETGNKFRGVKMIPPGLHFIHYSAMGSFGNMAPRIGFFHFFRKGEMLVRRWDPENEEVTAKGISEEAIERLKANILELDQFLGPYPLDIWENWKMLSDKITGPLLRKLVPESGYIRSALELSAPASQKRGSIGVEKTDDTNKRKFESEQSTSVQKSDVQSADSEEKITILRDEKDKWCRKRLSRPLTLEEREEALLPELKPLAGTELRLTKFPDCNYPDGATPAEISFHSMDLSYALETMLKRHDSDIDIVGELQFTFICFMVGQSLEAFDHWKRLVVLICESETAISSHQGMFDSFLWALEPQLWEIQEDFLADIVSNNNAVYHSLRTLFRNIADTYNNLDERFKTRVGRFKDRLTEKFSWDFDDLEKEDDDEAPVIVETDIV